MRTCALLLLSLCGAVAARAECSLGIGGVVYRHENLQSDHVPVASVGCELDGFDLRLRYFAAQDVTRERPWGPTRYVTKAHAALSVMRMWNVHRGWRVQPVLGVGLLFKSSDSPPWICGSARDAGYTTCRGDPWTPLPVEFSFAGTLRGEHWSVGLTHVSNAYLNSYNWGQNSIELG